MILIKQKPLNRGAHCISQDYYYVHVNQDMTLVLESWTMPYLILFYITIIVLEVDSCKISKDVLFPQSISLLSHLCGGCQNTPIVKANSAT